jgi:hypothetical protein
MMEYDLLREAIETEIIVAEVWPFFSFHLWPIDGVISFHSLLIDWRSYLFPSSFDGANK